MSDSISGQSRTPPHLKWLLNEHAMLLGEVQRRETRIQRITSEAEQLRSRILVLDSAMALFDSRVNPRAGGTVTSADVLAAAQFSTVDGFFTEGQEGKLTNDETGLGPRQAHDGDGANQARKPPPEPHEEPAKNKPQKITDSTHF